MKYTLHGDLFKNVEDLKIIDMMEDNPRTKDYIVHGCNAQGVMASGFAKAVREKYPKSYKDYKEAYDRYGLHVGETVLSLQDDETTIVNAITQKFYGRNPDIQYVSYDAIWMAFSMFEDHFMHYNFDKTHKIRIHYPKIGAGLGGGDWNIIESIIDECLDGKYDQFLHLGD